MKPPFGGISSFFLTPNHQTIQNHPTRQTCKPNFCASRFMTSIKHTLLSQLTLAVRKTGDISCCPGATSLCFTAMGQPIFSISAWAMSSNSWALGGACFRMGISGV